MSRPVARRCVLLIRMKLNLCLTLIAGIGLVCASSSGQSRPHANDPDLKEMRDYKLSMDVIQRYVVAVKKAGTDAAAKSCFEKNSPGDAPSLDAGEKLIAACPAAVADLKSAGLKPREFLIITASLIGDVMAVGMKKNGTIKEYPPSISPENVAFIEQNYDKLQAMLAPLSGGH